MNIPTPQTAQDWQQAIYAHIRAGRPEVLQTVLPALNAYPHNSSILLLAVIGALHDERPEQALRFLQRFSKNFLPRLCETQLLRAIALAQQGQWSQAREIIKEESRVMLVRSVWMLPFGDNMSHWYSGWLDRITAEEKRRTAAEKAARKKSVAPAAKPAKPAPAKAAKTASAKAAAPPEPKAEPAAPAPDPLPRYQIRIPLSLSLPETLEQTLAATISNTNSHDREAFRLRYELTQLSLLQGFDELLCLPTLHNIETYWYQVETVRKVLKQFRGRVLLADEVGLGKTIEAGMVLKEYLLRGMAERVLVLTPASLVGQWREEMASKFDVDFATTYDNLVRSDAQSFWAQPRVIASIATARRSEHQELLAQQNYDLVIVDEAHHLKNRTTANYKLVNALNKRFLLLLSATPVQNSLVELYNLLTLLKPGIFKTEKDFRTSYMTSGKPRVPANRERMRDLMRDVMIRNTRSLVDVRLPPRHASLLRVEPLAEEAACYQELSALVQEAHQKASAQQRLALRHLLSAAGSTPATAAAAIGRYLRTARTGSAWRELRERYESLPLTGKEQTLLELLARNPAEKKMIFVHHRDTLARLAELLIQEKIPFTTFDGSLSGPEKDAAIAQFRDDVPLLLCTESGGEGRNLQFCNTLINFDLPWNPMTIEQRIGRIHRIGQTREVFIFNLAVNGTLEEQVLRILDEKINMFELVVGEIDAILGEMDEEQDFAELVFQAWVETTEAERASAFASLGARLAEAKSQYDEVKAFDEELFGEEFVAG